MGDAALCLDMGKVFGGCCSCLGLDSVFFADCEFELILDGWEAEDISVRRRTPFFLSGREREGLGSDIGDTALCLGVGIDFRGCCSRRFDSLGGSGRNFFADCEFELTWDGCISVRRGREGLVSKKGDAELCSSVKKKSSECCCSVDVEVNARRFDLLDGLGGNVFAGCRFEPTEGGCCWSDRDIQVS